ncbi:Modification methylase PvuII [Planktothrix tepida]|uniref:site-specific DNA-methyltransferase (cytosine-N(4)-specific) n=1 Tax=Planktothrix tepida PCC 9214 TaxID=671072 RepID=A0A1J1LVE7_9CYAN|nr:PmeII family type II restriction endonuclease [Planktothrix tepida]CAD5978413.1 Modification methylase PvuII [Planktothrix tepida]CUR36082.1 DNA methylase N-4/N-6 domain protein [Planktothrix tepida PCC 9214]
MEDSVQPQYHLQPFKVIGGDSGYSKLELKSQETLINWNNQIILGNCLNVLKQIPDHQVDLVITSPPYADSRSKTYGGIHPEEYVNWFLPISAEIKRVLKFNGTFILNIKEKVVNGERHNYVIKLILELQKQGWLWTEEYIWHKKNSYPGKWPNRFRDAWERCLQFNQQKKFKMYQEQVMVPMGDWAKNRLKNLSEVDQIRDNSKVESGFGKNVSNWVGRTMVYPANVLHLATECGNKNHSAAFPKSLPSWFIKLFTEPNDLVLDPFVGSGTTCIAAKELGRNYLGIEIKEDYCNLALSNLDKTVFNVQNQDSVIETISTDSINSNITNSTITQKNYQIYNDYLINHVLSPFYNKRFEKLNNLKLKDILKRKNPYLFKAKNIELAGDFVKSIVDAFLSSQEETIFGHLLESFAIYISETLYGGFKSTLNSVDLEFERGRNYYIVGIKSGINWGNSDQINRMKDNFKKAKNRLREEGKTCDIIAVNGCIYGKDKNPLKTDQDPDKTYYKYAGQDFWNFIAEDDNLYQQMIVPIDIEAQKKDESFKTIYSSKINQMTQEFMQNFMKDNQIDWVKLVDYVSKREENPLDPAIEQLSLDLELGDSET